MSTTAHSDELETDGGGADNRASLPILVPAFFAAISALLFGVRYAALIRGAYVPETETPATATATREDGTVDLDAAVAVLREADWRARVRSRLPSKTTSCASHTALWQCQS